MSDEKPVSEAPPAKDSPLNGAGKSAPPDASAEATEARGAADTTASADTAEGAEAEAAAPGDEPVSKKRKRKRKRREEPALRESLRPDGRERPAFLLRFPDDPELERLIRAFELGDYATVRKQAPALAERTTDLKVRAAAEELARRIEPDPLVKILLALSIVLFVLLAFWAYKTHGM